MNLKIFCFMTVGPRSQQEDCILITNQVFQGDNLIRDGSFGGKTMLLVVCDGMGGHAAGEKASRFICKGLKKEFDPEQFSEKYFIRTMRAIQKNMTSHLPPRCGSTIVGMGVQNNQALVFNAGDSRLYKITENDIRCMSHDHSSVQEMVDRNIITEEEAFDHPRKNEITMGMGPIFDKEWPEEDSFKAVRERSETNNAYIDMAEVDEKIRAADVYIAQDLFDEAMDIYTEILACTPESYIYTRQFIQEKIDLLTDTVSSRTPCRVNFCQEELKPKTRYLICSDGVNDVLRDHEIFNVFNKNRVDDGMALIHELKNRNLKDNTSFIILEVLDY
ncbi:hypothetical protein QUF90_24380 [Desulfococcaceae bacterium HSG9]|nr:hypothetical protein [Desulfococcaceae bacterium HSG9]